jgi:hypothetical protein
MATTTTNFGWDIPQSTDLVKDGATAIAALGQDIDTAMVDLKGGTTGQVLAKASGTDLDFSWVAQDDSNAIQNAIVDAKGDLISATAADTPARLAVGADNTVLTADSSTATGLKWATPSSTAGLIPIASTSFTSSTAVNIDNVFSSTYKSYRIVINLSSSANETINMRMRTSGSNYTASTYNQRGYVSTNALANIFDNNQAQFFLGQSPQSTFGAVIDIYSPFLTAYTGFTHQQVGLSAGVSSDSRSTHGFIDASRSDTGFTIYGGSTGSLTGTILTYGYKE